MELIMARLKGKKALITGGTSGIGLETARRFLEEGAQVAVTGQNPKTLKEAGEALKGAIVISSDAGDAKAQKVLAERVQREFGKLDILFANAGIAIFQPLDAWDEATFDKQFAVNVKGPYFLLQALLPHFGNPASVILNSSVAAHVGMANSAAYGATKAAIGSFARTLSGEWAERGIRINSISPGPISTPIFGKLGIPQDQLAATAEGIRQSVPLKRFGTPRDIADAAVFLASDESAFMLGSEIIVDGGLVNV
jgi:NAD(P)-dependent dehydrogenase (short-subunit alcohol dehydrogenase family)